MPDISDQSSAKKQEVETLLRRADHLANFGTLTSLASTAFYFIEQALAKKLPKWLNNLSLAAVGVGLAAVFSSFYMRYKAGNMALEHEAPKHEAPVAPDVPSSAQLATRDWKNTVQNNGQGASIGPGH